MQHTNASAAESYNALLGIAQASQAFDKRNGEATVGRCLTLIIDAGLQHELGIRLLHKHNDLSSREVMFEVGVRDEEGFALVTSDTDRDGVKGAVANSWQLTDDGYIPVEFSEPRLVQPHFSMLQQNGIFAKIGEVLLQDKMSDLLGPCLHYSPYVDQYAPSVNSAFLEKTDEISRANVVRYVMRDDIAFERSAKTKWRAERMLDASGKLIWTTACNCYCAVSPEGSGHMGTTYHQVSGKEDESGPDTR